MDNVYVIDRIEDGIITLVSENGETEINVPFVEGFNPDDRVIYENGILTHCGTPEHEQRKKDNQSRLNALFARSKDNNED